MDKAGVYKLQRDMNEFTGKYLDNFPRLRVDGIRGHSTNTRIRSCKWYIGYTGSRQRSSRVTQAFRRRLEHPKSDSNMPHAMLLRGARRRHIQREHQQKPPTSGVAVFDGRKCAAWLKPYLQWARDHGWDGTLVSGWRDPVYSEQLCYRMCGHPSCPGRCAGRNSNHSGSTKPFGALDVSWYSQFAGLMRQCPYSPRIFNALGAQDPVHFSATGR